MRLITLLLIALTGVGVVSATASAKPVTKTYNVSLYGVQRYTNTQTEADVHPEKCFGARGTTISRSIVNFHTARPVRVRATFSPGYVSLRFPESDLPIPVIADWEHNGETNREERSCDGSQGDAWYFDPPPIPVNCHKTLDNHGFNLNVRPGQVEVSGTASTFVPIGNPCEGCPWGDQSIELYGAKAKLHAALIRDSDQQQAVLRGREHTHSENPDGSGSTDMVKQQTVYVTFKRLS
jgi:hypothetical protein